MGKTILTTKQLNFLEFAQAQASITKNFYFTGRTALSEFYFQHRLSEDIDLFSEQEVDPGAVEAFLEEVSSIYDIAVNKIHTIAMRSRVRDYIDLYFIFERSEHPYKEYLEKIRIDSQAKFDWPLEVKNLVAAFLKVKDFKKEDYPKMLISFNQQKMEDFFIKLAKKLKKEIFA